MGGVGQAGEIHLESLRAVCGLSLSLLQLLNSLVICRQFILRDETEGADLEVVGVELYAGVLRLRCAVSIYIIFLEFRANF